MAPQRTVIEAEGRRLAVSMRGQGRDVVLIPSHGRGAVDFDDLAARLDAAGFRTLALDPRGVGESTGPQGPVTLHDLARDAALVIKALCTAPVDVVGHANGQRIARCLAADRPDLVDRLVLLACGGKLPLPALWARYGELYDRDLPLEQRMEVLSGLFFGPGADASVWLDGWWQEARLLQDRANEAVALQDWWHGGAAPMLVIQGTHDIVAPPGNGHLLAGELGERVSVIDLPGVGHAMLPERPGEIAAAMVAWLQRGRPRHLGASADSR